MKRKPLQRFLTEHRTEIDAAINRVLGPGSGVRLNDRERRLWVLNDESLYKWARSEGVSV